KIILWNVRGLNEMEKHLKIINQLQKWRVDIVCLQETKLELITINTVRSLWGCSRVGWAHLPSNGASGGIVMM
ncbi:hypothetical protein I3760_16G075000, partial [Carya illinoinensis]